MSVQANMVGVRLFSGDREVVENAVNSYLRDLTNDMKLVDILYNYQSQDVDETGRIMVYPSHGIVVVTELCAFK